MREQKIWKKLMEIGKWKRFEELFGMVEDLLEEEGFAL